MIDTRDLQKRLDELIEIRDNYNQAEEELNELVESDFQSPEDYEEALAEAEQTLKNTENLTLEEFKELEELEQLKDEIGDEWKYGVTLIPEDEFEEYCQDMLKDCGDLTDDFPSYIVIDWEQTAENLKMDYSTCEYQGETYLYRS